MYVQTRNGVFGPGGYGGGIFDGSEMGFWELDEEADETQTGTLVVAGLVVAVFVGSLWLLDQRTRRS